MIKHGGQGKLKQACSQRRCSNPGFSPKKGSGNTSRVEVEEPPTAITEVVAEDIEISVMDSSSSSSLIVDENPGVDTGDAGVALVDCAQNKGQSKKTSLDLSRSTNEFQF